MWREREKFDLRFFVKSYFEISSAVISINPSSQRRIVCIFKTDVDIPACGVDIPASGVGGSFDRGAFRDYARAINIEYIKLPWLE